MVLSSPIHKVLSFELDYSVTLNSMPTIELLNEVYTLEGGNTAVIEWRYKLKLRERQLISFVFETTAKIKEVADIDTDMPVIENLIKDSYNMAAWDFKQKGGTLPLCEPTQLNETALRLLEALVASDLYH